MDARKLSRDGKSLYAELELSNDASEEDIKRQYRKLALRFHPDKNPGSLDAIEKFKTVNKAHKTLMDPTKRKIYDRYGSFGLYLLDTVGEENVRTYAMLSTWWCQGLLLCSAIFSCCCCCLCCCCCCGRIVVSDEEEIPDAEDLDANGSEPVTTQQPRFSSNGAVYTIPVTEL